MNVVADLLSLVTVNAINTLLDVAPDEVTEKPVKLDTAVIRPGKAAAAQAAGLHPEIASVLLHHEIGSGLRRTEDTVLALIDRERLCDAIAEFLVRVVPARSLFLERDVVWRVAVDLVRAHENKSGIGRAALRRLEEIQRA